jgi:radical SAM protein with 4Fe4S-binding SPASM domain
MKKNKSLTFPIMKQNVASDSVVSNSAISDLSIGSKRNQLDLVNYVDGYPLFGIVEFNLIGACNRSCDFCPVSEPDFYKKNNMRGRLTLSFCQHIAEELAKLKFEGLILFSGYSEPLLHNKVVSFVEILHRTLPKCRIEINSNGDLLNVKNIRDLHKAGLSEFKVSMYDGAHQIKDFNDLIEESGVENFVTLRRRYYQDDNYGIIFSNRAGLIDVSGFNGDEDEKISTKDKPCYYPFYMIKIDFNGDVLMCSHDWKKEYIVGNLNKENLKDIWLGSKEIEIKKMLLNSKRDKSPCNKCDVMGDVMGINQYEAWKKVLISNETDTA